MSVSVYIEAIIPYDSEKFELYRSVLEACEKAGLAPPAEVDEFFMDEDRVETIVWPEGKLPEGVTKLRVFMS